MGGVLVASEADWRALAAACPSSPLGRRDRLLLWFAYGLALSEQHVVQLGPWSVTDSSLWLVNNRRVHLSSQAARTVAAALEAACALQPELSARQRGAFPVHPRYAALRLEETAREAGLEGLTWRALRRGGLMRCFRLDGWRAAEQLGQAVDLSLSGVLELVDELEPCGPVPVQTVPLLEVT